MRMFFIVGSLLFSSSVFAHGGESYIGFILCYLLVTPLIVLPWIWTRRYSKWKRGALSILFIFSLWISFYISSKTPYSLTLMSGLDPLIQSYSLKIIARFGLLFIMLMILPIFLLVLVNRWFSHLKS